MPDSYSFSQLKRKTLKKQLTSLYEQYEAVNAQLSRTLNEGDRVLLRQQLENLEQEIKQREQKLDQITEPDTSGNGQRDPQKITNLSATPPITLPDKSDGNWWKKGLLPILLLVSVTIISIIIGLVANFVEVESIPSWLQPWLTWETLVVLGILLVIVTILYEKTSAIQRLLNSMISKLQHLSPLLIWGVVLIIVVLLLSSSRAPTTIVSPEIVTE